MKSRSCPDHSRTLPAKARRWGHGCFRSTGSREWSSRIRPGAETSVRLLLRTAPASPAGGAWHCPRPDRRNEELGRQQRLHLWRIPPWACRRSQTSLLYHSVTCLFQRQANRGDPKGAEHERTTCVALLACSVSLLLSGGMQLATTCRLPSVRPRQPRRPPRLRPQRSQPRSRITVAPSRSDVIDPGALRSCRPGQFMGTVGFLVNEQYVGEDWTKGPAGTGEVDWYPNRPPPRIRPQAFWPRAGRCRRWER